MMNVNSKTDRNNPSRATGGWPLAIGSDASFWRLVVAEIHQWQKSAGIAATHLTIVLPFVQLLAPIRYAWSKEIGDGFSPRFETTQTWAARIGGVHRAGAGPTTDPILDYLQAQSWLTQIGQEQAIELADALIEPLVGMATDLMQAAGAVPPSEREAYWSKVATVAEQVPPGVAGVEAALGPLALAWARATEGWESDALFNVAEKSQTLAEQTATGLIIIQAGGEEQLTNNLYELWSTSHRLWVNLDTFEGYSESIPTKSGGASTHQKEATEKPYVGQTSLFDFEEVVGDASVENIVEGNETLIDPLVLIAQKLPIEWQRAKDAEDEAQRAAAKVISLLNNGISPVALCSQDRPIARRTWALLARQSIAMADETGWTLSTTRSAALAMGLVNAATLHATPDDILDAFKTLPRENAFIKGLDPLEKYLRQSNSNNWPKEGEEYWESEAKTVLLKINELLANLQGQFEQNRRTLWQHLQALEQAFKRSMAWSTLIGDEAGREVLQTLHIHELEEINKEDVGTKEDLSLSLFAQSAQETEMSYFEFSQWVSRTLESVTFIPPAPEHPQVIVTPLARVMLRPFAAVVIPGCDDSRLTSPPSLSGFWNEADRIELGLMSREQWWQRLQAQWAQALRLPQVTLIWRIAEGSQPLSPASLVQRVIPEALIKEDTLIQQQRIEVLKDQRERYAFQPKPTFTPAPQPANRFPIKVISASAYTTLRECPYKYYARYMLALYKQNELDGELTRRDYGNWLHAVLRQFHVKRAYNKAESVDVVQERVLLDECAAEHAQELDEASLIPWQARWPALRDAYLAWLITYEAKGGHFIRAEFAMEYALSDDVTLQGKIDRLDQNAGIPLFIDYKTERLQRTKNRVRDPYEDVQLPFYALLAQGSIRHDAQAHISNTDQAKAIYLSLDDSIESAEAVEQKALQEVKVLLEQSILNDLGRLEQGFPAYPIGQAQACTYCDVNGLCRKGYWTEPLDEESRDGAE